jgi:hypothetical protein
MSLSDCCTQGSIVPGDADYCCNSVTQQYCNGYCCAKGWQCGEICCPPNTIQVTNNTGTGYTCCPPEQVLTTPGDHSTCCAVGTYPSGDICCPTGQHNTNGICCPDGQYNSNGLCCSQGTERVELDTCCPTTGGVYFAPAPGVCCIFGTTWFFQNGISYCCADGTIPTAPTPFGAICCAPGLYNSKGHCVPVGFTWQITRYCQDGWVESTTGGSECCPSATPMYSSITQTCCTTAAYTCVDDSFGCTVGHCCPGAGYSVSFDASLQEYKCCPTGQQSYEGACIDSNLFCETSGGFVPVNFQGSPEQLAGTAPYNVPMWPMAIMQTNPYSSTGSWCQAIFTIPFTGGRTQPYSVCCPSTNLATAPFTITPTGARMPLTGHSYVSLFRDQYNPNVLQVACCPLCSQYFPVQPPGMSYQQTIMDYPGCTNPSYQIFDIPKLWTDIWMQNCAPGSPSCVSEPYLVASATQWDKANGQCPEVLALQII